MNERTFRPQVKRIPITHGGRLDSKDLSAFVDAVVNDLHELSTIVADIVNKIDGESLKTKLQESDLRERIQAVQKSLESRLKAEALDSAASPFALSFHDSSVITHLADSAVANRAQADTVFGIALPPLNAVEHRFLIENVRSGTFSALPDLAVDVTGTFDAGDGDGVVDHEGGDEVDAGQPEYAFNGNNNRRWVRRVEMPLESDATEIMTELTVTIPEQSSSLANCFYILPFPEGELDIVNVYSSADLSNSFVALPGFEEVSAAGPVKHFFPARQVQRLKIRFRQKNWVEEDGKRVFYVGAQEIGLLLADFDKTYSSENEPSENNTIVLKATAPAGYSFTKITKLFTEPDFTLEDPGSRHIHIKLDRAGDGSDVVWDSDADTLPQDTVGNTPFTATENLYWIITLNFVDSSGGVSSPFEVGTPPYLKTLFFEAETAETV